MINKGYFVLMILAAILMSGCSTALSVHAVGHSTTARAENKEAAAVVVAVNDVNGPVTGLTIANFQAMAGPVAAGGCLVEITRVVSNFPGRYLLDVKPISSNPSCVWKAGRYVIAVNVANNEKAGTGVTDLSIVSGTGSVTACADALCKESIVIKSASDPINPGSAGTTLMPCDAGYTAVAGGYGFDNPSDTNPNFKIKRSSPGTMADGRTAWFITFENVGSRASLSTHVTCVKTSS